jgi:hypothetical protein
MLWSLLISAEVSTMVVWHVLLSAAAAGNVAAAYISATVLFYPMLCIVLAGSTLNLSVATLFATFECIALHERSRVGQLLQVEMWVEICAADPAADTNTECVWVWHAHQQLRAIRTTCEKGINIVTACLVSMQTDAVAHLQWFRSISLYVWLGCAAAPSLMHVNHSPTVANSTLCVLLSV